MASYVKSILKDAREAIKNKDYQAALKLCKAVLKQDKENYMGLVFLGISLQEIGPIDQAEKAFQKAIELNPNNVLAWNGLMNYYEKLKSDDSKSQLLGIYLKMLELESHDKKLIEICEKLSSFKDISEDYFNQVVERVYKTAKAFTDQIVSIIPWSVLVTIISERNEKVKLTDEQMQMFEDGLSALVHNTQSVTIEYFSNYLKVLYQRKRYSLLIEEAKKMNLIYEESCVPLEWICKLYNELRIEENDLAAELKLTAQEFYNILQRVNPSSSMGLFTKAVLLYDSNNIIEAKDILKEVTSLRSGLLHAWILLTCCYIKLKLYVDALKSSEKAEKLLTSLNNSNNILCQKLTKLQVEILSKHSLEENWEKCIKMCKEIVDENKDKTIILSLIRSYVNLGKTAEARAELEKIKDKDALDLSIALVESKLAQKEGKVDVALEILKHFEESNNSELWLEIGLLYWEKQAYDKSGVPFLKAAKLDPNCYLPFLYLGHYYKKCNDFEKSRKCFEKAYKINSNCMEAALELSEIYRKLENWDANLSLLQNLTEGSVKNFNQWAWVQLGVSYLQQQDFERAIDTWRYLVRCEPSNSHFWEGLADSYLARGSYLSALKSYQKASDISPKSLYPLLQMANVKRALGQYSEARSDFENILASNEKYVPALKGLAETCLNQGRLFNKKELLGLARDCTQYALDNLILAIQERSDFSCLWKLAADCCYLTASLPEKYCCLLVPSSVIEGRDTEGNKVLERNDMYELAAKYYCKSLSLVRDNILIWHDLACCYLTHAKSISEPEKAKILYDRALAVAFHCIKENPGNWQHWNLLGNISISKEPNNYALAQHAFIKAVTVDHNSAVAWSNLGSLYLKLNELKLANEAFAKAQRADPSYVNSWVGQALVAETVGVEEAMDLFRHSTQLGMQMQGALGYGYWVCQTLMNSPPHMFIYSIHKMHAIPVACDALTWYIEKNPYDSCAWNMLGLLRERMRLKRSSLEAYKNAYRFCKEAYKDKVKVNCGRLLFEIGRYSEAIDFYRDVREATFKSGSGLALALFKDKQYEDSYEAYKSALDWLTEEQSHQSDLLVALASMAYMFQGPDAAKILLFQSVKCNPPSPFGYYATLSLSLLHEDFKLAEAVVKEIYTLKDKIEYLPHISLLLSHFYILKEEPTKVVRELSKLVHRHPDQAELWLSLGLLFIRLHEERQDVIKAASKCAQVAVKLDKTKLDIKKTLCIISLLCLLAEDRNQAVKAAQKAVHSYPDTAECWCVLIFTLSLNRKEGRKHKPFLRKSLKYANNLLNTSTPLKNWLSEQDNVIKKL